MARPNGRGGGRQVAVLAFVLWLVAANPLEGQFRLEPAIAVGATIPLGDLATAARVGFGTDAIVMIRSPKLRYAFGLEGSFHQFTLDPVPDRHDGSLPTWMLNGRSSHDVGAMIRYEYNIIHQSFYAVGGAGIYFTSIEFQREDFDPETITSRDVTAQAGVGYRGPGGLRVEARVVNVFTVNESRRFIPLTVGLRF